MPAERYTYVLRLTRDQDGRIQGQLQEPISGWHSAYLDFDDLWVALAGRMAPTADEATSPPEKGLA
jgi:hypothetical protein